MFAAKRIPKAFLKPKKGGKTAPHQQHQQSHTLTPSLKRKEGGKGVLLGVFFITTPIKESVVSKTLPSLTLVKEIEKEMFETGVKGLRGKYTESSSHLGQGG